MKIDNTKLKMEQRELHLPHYCGSGRFGMPIRATQSLALQFGYSEGRAHAAPSFTIYFVYFR
jgi:hypothetical protein